MNKKISNVFFDEYNDFYPKKQKIEKKLKSKQISFSELDYDDFNSTKAKKYVNNKRYSRDL